MSRLSESFELSIDNVPIKQVSTAKSLGIIIDDTIYCYYMLLHIIM